jgi:hypothetical protein
MEADTKRYTELLDVSEPLELHRTGRDQHIITFQVSLKALAERTVGGAMMCSPNAKDDVRHVRLGVENICITWGRHINPQEKIVIVALIQESE